MEFNFVNLNSILIFEHSFITFHELLILEISSFHRYVIFVNSKNVQIQTVCIFKFSNSLRIMQYWISKVIKIDYSITKGCEINAFAEICERATRVLDYSSFSRILRLLNPCHQSLEPRHTGNLKRLNFNRKLNHRRNFVHPFEFHHIHWKAFPEISFNQEQEGSF